MVAQSERARREISRPPVLPPTQIPEVSSSIPTLSRGGYRRVSDSVLVEGAKRGDTTSFDELVRRHSPTVYALALRLTRNEEEAKDVAQESFVRAWRAVGRFRGDARFSTWMYRITANTAASALGRTSRTMAHPLDDQIEQLCDATPGPEAVAEGRDLHNRIQQAVSELPTKLRAVITLRERDGLAHEAIAAELGISVANAKMRLHRARTALRSRLNAGDRAL